MPVWSLIGSALIGGSQVSGWDIIFNTSYKSVIGNDIEFLFGGGLIANIYGYKIEMIIDWEYFVSQMLPDSLSLPLPTTGLGQVARGLLGNGGETGIVYGNTTDFVYYGQNLTVERSPNHPIEINPPKLYTLAQQDAFNTIKSASPTAAQLAAAQGQVNTAMQAQIEKIIAAGYLPFTLQLIPIQIQECFAVGVLGLFAVTMILRFYNGVDSVYDSSATDEQTQLVLAIASSVISQLETTWIYLLSFLEIQTSTTYNIYNTIVIKTNADIAVATAKVALLEADIAEATSLLTTLTPIMKAIKEGEINSWQKQLADVKVTLTGLTTALSTAQNNLDISVLTNLYDKAPAPLPTP